MICRLRNIFFVHIPKTAGTSIEKVLFANHSFCNAPDYESLYGWDSNYGWLNHLTVDEARVLKGDFFAKVPTVFTVIRNPWDRLVSEFFWKRLQIVAKIDFKDFVELLYRKEHAQLAPCYRAAVALRQHIRPQSDFVSCDLPLHIIRFENLELEFEQLMSEIGQHRISLERKRASDHRDYREYYSEGTAGMVYDVYRDDVDAFGYEFD